jgi:predicted nucleic acid-binding protein
MISTHSRKYTAVLDACVLIPMCLCDTLLRFAEEPALYRPLWSELILKEAGNGLVSKIGLTAAQRDHRLREMKNAFPEAMISPPQNLIEALEGLPDADDRHVLASAISGRADAIITANIRDFPQSVLNDYGVLCRTPDDFLIEQLTLSEDTVMERLGAQAAAIRRDWPAFIQTVNKVAPKFARLIEKRRR